jgi:DNA-directed RNA polymerase subunit delta
MYSVGENFYFEIDGEEYEYSVIGDMITRGKEYLVAENEENEKVVFLYDDMEEVVILVDSEEEQEALIELWENEFYGTSGEVGFWDDDEYTDDIEDEEEEYIDIDGLNEFDDEDNMYF